MRKDDVSPNDDDLRAEYDASALILKEVSAPSISIRSVLSCSGAPPTSSSSTASEEGGTSGRPMRVGSADRNLCMIFSETLPLLICDPQLA